MFPVLPLLVALSAKGVAALAATGLAVADYACGRRLVAILPVRVGEERFELRLRTVSKPDRMAAELLSHLGLQLPARSKIIENVVQKNG